MTKLIIFDLDGTLLNSVEDLGRAVNHALKLRNLPLHSMDEYRYFVGNGVRKLIERALRATLGHDAEQELQETVLQDFMAYYIEHKCDYTMPYDGIPELLRNLNKRGVKIAVASNKFITGTQALVQNFFPDINFTAVLGQREGVPVKPDPQIVNDILSMAGTMASETLYVGDTGIDMQTARNAGIESIGVLWGFRTKEELIENGAVHIVSEPSEILDLL